MAGLLPDSAKSLYRMNQPTRTAPPPMTSGTVINDRYEIRQSLGKGGMGEVFLAYDRTTQQAVALKIVREKSRMPGDDEALRQELLHAHSVGHPNVCRVHDLAPSIYGPISVMEHITGQRCIPISAERRPRAATRRTNFDAWPTTSRRASPRFTPNPETALHCRSNPFGRTSPTNQDVRPEHLHERDDLLGLAGGGNKTRKLEFLVADALLAGADTLITCGAVQSNHCRLTLAAAAKEGLKCRFVLEERVPKSYKQDASGNNFLFNMLGIEKVTVVPSGSDMMKAMLAVAEEVAAEGRKAYIIPGGGSDPIGATGYVACAEEILAQAFDQGINFDYIVTTSGSAGTHAGRSCRLLRQQ